MKTKRYADNNFWRMQMIHAPTGFVMDNVDLNNMYSVSLEMKGEGRGGGKIE